MNILHVFFIFMLLQFHTHLLSASFINRQCGEKQFTGWRRQQISRSSRSSRLTQRSGCLSAQDGNGSSEASRVSECRAAVNLSAGGSPWRRKVNKWGTNWCLYGEDEVQRSLPRRASKSLLMSGAAGAASNLSRKGTGMLNVLAEANICGRVVRAPCKSHSIRCVSSEHVFVCCSHLLLRAKRVGRS